MTTSSTPFSDWFGPLPANAWRDVVRPKEHGSWSLAFEPIALGLLIAPSVGGAWFGLAVAAAFLIRRPLRIAWNDPNLRRRAIARSAFAVLAVIAMAAVGTTTSLEGAQWLAWLIPPAFCGGLFLWYDLQQSGRDGMAEIAGSAAFGFLPAAFAALAGWESWAAAALGLVMCARAVPTVMFVRTMVRARKGQPHTFALALAATGSALIVVTMLALRNLAPWMAVIWAAIFLARAGLLRRHTALRPKTLGIIEAIAGAAFVLTLAFSSWR